MWLKKKKKKLEKKGLLPCKYYHKNQRFKYALLFMYLCELHKTFNAEYIELQKT